LGKSYAGSGELSAASWGRVTYDRTFIGRGERYKCAERKEWGVSEKLFCLLLGSVKEGGHDTGTN
jgi:hypothetical protein